MDYKDFHKALLVGIAWEAASDSGFNAMVAVMQCLRNRVKNDDWMSAITAEIKGGDYVLGQETIDTRDPKFINILTAVDQVYDGTRTDMTAGCTYFTRFTTDPVIASQNYETKMGYLYFYRPRKE